MLIKFLLCKSNRAYKYISKQLYIGIVVISSWCLASLALICQTRIKASLIMEDDSLLSATTVVTD